MSVLLPLTSRHLFGRTFFSLQMSDMTITPLIVSSDRAQRIDFSNGMTDIRFVAITKSRNSLDLNDLLNYSSNVEPIVWLFIAIFAIVVVIINKFQELCSLSPNDYNQFIGSNSNNYLSVWNFTPLFLEQCE